MFTAYLIVTAIAIVASAFAAAADLMPARFVLATMAEVGVPRSWLLPLAFPKAAAAVGLLIGLLGARPLRLAPAIALPAARPLGLAAAIGLVLFFTGALATHIRARVFHNIAAPATFLALALAATTLSLATH